MIGLVVHDWFAAWKEGVGHRFSDVGCECVVHVGYWLLKFEVGIAELWRALGIWDTGGDGVGDGGYLEGAVVGKGTGKGGEEGEGEDGSGRHFELLRYSSARIMF